MTLAQMYFLRRELHGRLDGRRTLIVAIQITFAAALLAGASYGTWYVLDQALGVGLPAQLLTVGSALVVGVVGLRARGAAAGHTGGAPDRGLRPGTACSARRTVENSR